MANIVKKYSMNAKGILSIDGDIVGLENTDTGEFFQLSTLLEDFKDRLVKLGINYDEDYE